MLFSNIAAKSDRRGFAEDREAAVAILMALSLPAMAGLMGLGTEVGYWNALQRDLQHGVDSAAHAGAVEYSESGNELRSISMAYSAAMLNGIEGSALSVQFVDDPAGRAISVSTSISAPRFFSQLFTGSDPIDIAASSTGLVRPARAICMLALGEDGSGVSIHGTALMDAPGCSLHSNATHNNAVYANGSTNYRMDCISAAGTFALPPSNYQLLECPNPDMEMQVLDDPYVDVVAPSTATVPFNNLVNNFSGSTISSGRYSNIRVKNDVTFDDGATVIVDGGRLFTQGNATLSGTNVTIILINGAEIEFGSNAQVSLSAKTTGDYAGLVIIGDRDPGVETHRMRGATNNEIQGAVYLPTGSLEMTGGAGSDLGCSHFVAFEIDLVGNSQLRNNCAGTGVRPIRLNKMAGFGYLS